MACKWSGSLQGEKAGEVRNVCRGPCSPRSVPENLKKTCALEKNVCYEAGELVLGKFCSSRCEMQRGLAVLGHGNANVD